MTDNYILQLYGDFSFLFFGLYFIQLLILLFSKSFKELKGMNRLILILAISSLYCLLNYFSTITSSSIKDSSPCLMSVSFIAGCSYLYLSIITEHLNIKKLFYKVARFSFITITVLAFISLVMQTILNWNPLFSNEVVVSSNVFLTNGKAIGIPKLSMKIIMLIYGFFIYLSSIGIALHLLKQKHTDWLLFIGQFVTIAVVTNDFLLFDTNIKYILPLSSMSFIVEILRFSFLYQKGIKTRVEDLKQNVIHLSKVAEVGFGVSHICHDIRGPLNSISFASEIIRKDASKDHCSQELIKSSVSKIDYSIDFITKIIDSNLARVRKTEPLSRKKVFVAKLVDEALEFNQERVDKILDYCKVIEESEDPIIVETNTYDMIMVFSNLISNSLDAIEMAKDNDEKWIRIVIRPHRNNVIMRFYDNGIGISNDEVRKIFLNGYSTKGDNGTGLGLSFAQNVVEQHSGELRLDTKENETCFEIVLPRAK